MNNKLNSLDTDVSINTLHLSAQNKTKLWQKLFANMHVLS